MRDMAVRRDSEMYRGGEGGAGFSTEGGALTGSAAFCLWRELAADDSAEAEDTSE